MTDTPSGIEDPTPFSPRPVETLPAGPARRRLIGCAAVLVVLALLLVIAVAKAPEIFGWILESIEREVTAALPPEVGAAERLRLERAFDAAREAVMAGRARAGDLTRLKEEIDGLAEKRFEEVTAEEVARLTAALEQVASAAGGGARETLDVPVSIALPVHPAG